LRIDNEGWAAFLMQQVVQVPSQPLFGDVGWDSEVRTLTPFALAALVNNPPLTVSLDVKLVATVDVEPCRAHPFDVIRRRA
jgi:hypothetical protein